MTTKILQHEVSRAQVKFLESINDRGGLAYVAVAVPSAGPGVDVYLVPFDAWEVGSEAFDGKNVTQDWLRAHAPRSVQCMRGNLSKGFLAVSGPLEASFA